MKHWCSQEILFTKCSGKPVPLVAAGEPVPQPPMYTHQCENQADMKQGRQLRQSIQTKEPPIFHIAAAKYMRTIRWKKKAERKCQFKLPDRINLPHRP